MPGADSRGNEKLLEQKTKEDLRMKKVFAMLLAVLLLSTSALAAAVEYAVVNNPNTTDMLNLRREPDAGAESLGKYHTGVVVQVLEAVNDEWNKVRVGDVTGYMMRRYLEDPLGKKNIPGFTTSVLKNRYNAGITALLDSPGGAEQRVVANVADNAQVTVLGYTGGYAHVQYAGVTGYVPQDSIFGGAPFAEEENQGGNSTMPAERPVNAVPVRALLITGDGEYEITDTEKLHTIYKLLTSLDEWGENIAGCLFGANLLLEFPDDVAVMELATDGCNILRYNGHDFRYAFDLWQQDESTSGAVLFDLFGISP